MVREGVLERLLVEIEQADAIVIAVSNGFDIADGYNQFACDDEFLRVFGDLHRAYGLSNILQGLMARWPSAESRWEFLSRLIGYGYRDYTPSDVMRALDSLTSHAARFVVTCNCNGRFARAGFDPDALFETEGSYARLRCTASCSRTTYGALEMIDTAASVPPHCPRCAAPLDVAVDDSGHIVDLDPFAGQMVRFRRFLRDHASDRTLVLELGMGQANRAIKAPLMEWAERVPHASYVVVNREEAVLPTLADGRAFGIRDDLASTLIASAELQGWTR